MQSHTDILEALFVANHRVTRLAARSTGNQTSSATWSTLSVLTTDGPMRIGDLAKAARISQPGMTKLLQNLVETEWVRRIADTDDSRAWLIAIAPKGEAALSAWRHELGTALADSFDDLTADDWSVLERAAALIGSRVAQAAIAA
jgi:DNA-binding MarR family transcriptional regulator